MLEEIIKGFVNYTILVAPLGALCYFLIDWRYKKIEMKHQSMLDLKLAEVNSMLEQARGEHSVAFNLIYAKREERIASLWASWCAVRQEALDAIKPNREIGNLDALTKSVQAAVRELNKVDFYFPADFVDLWRDSLTKLHNACVMVHTARHQKNSSIEKDWDAMAAAHDEFLVVWNTTRGEMRRIVQRLIRVDSVDRAGIDKTTVVK